MQMPDYVTMKIRRDTHEQLKRRKDEGQSWSHFLSELDEKAQELERRRSDVL